MLLQFLSPIWELGRRKEKRGLAKRVGESEAYEGLNMAPAHCRPIVKMQKCSYAHLKSHSETHILYNLYRVIQSSIKKELKLCKRRAYKKSIYKL